MHGNLEDIVWTPWLSMMVWWLDDVDNYNDGDFGSLDDKDGYGIVDDVGVKYCWQRHDVVYSQDDKDSFGGLVMLIITLGMISTKAWCC